MSLPPFFNYKQENTDYGYETIQDFYLSWAFRCANEKYREDKENAKLHKYSKKMTLALLFLNKTDEGEFEPEHEKILEEKMTMCEITGVKTYRQWQRIDLIAEIVVKDSSEPASTNVYVLNIENKYYTDIKEHQLRDSKKYIENWYNKGEKLIHCVIFCDDEKITPKRRADCRNEGFKCLSIDDLRRQSSMDELCPTGNALFDEYWFPPKE